MRGIVTADSLQQVLDHYAVADWRAKRVVVTGDLIQDDSAEAYERFRDLMLPLKLRIHCVPGNHDVPALMRAVCGRPPFSYCAYEQVGDWLFVGIDSCVGSGAGGEVAREELDRLSDIVARSPARHVLLALHHPPVAVGSRWLDTVGLRNGDEVLERLRGLNRIRAVIFGHVHQVYDEDYHGIRILATPSTCRQFKPGSDEFAVDDKPPAYRRITLREDGKVDTELVWVRE
ncbi:MAG: metallophosphoesterase [Proteobacteria bacterium]|nr:metallophosphoesterase [Pseudomonadota bacterium]